MTTGNLPDDTVIYLRHRVRDLTNAKRVTYGNASALTTDGNLNDTAQAWANNMANRRTLYHSSLAAPNRYYPSVGENVGVGQTTADAIVKGWRQSCSHFYIMIHKGYHRIGTGVARASDGTYYWCSHYGGTSSPPCSKCNGPCGSHNFFSNDPWKPA